MQSRKFNLEENAWLTINGKTLHVKIVGYEDGNNLSNLHKLHGPRCGKYDGWVYHVIPLGQYESCPVQVGEVIVVHEDRLRKMDQPLPIVP